MSFFKFLVFVLIFLIIRRIYLNLKNMRFVIRTYRGPGRKTYEHPSPGPFGPANGYNRNAPSQDEAIEAEYKVLSQKSFHGPESKAAQQKE